MKKHFALTLASLLSIGIVGCQNSPENGNASSSSKHMKADASQLISRDVLFGNPDKAQGRLSWDGKQIAFVAPVDRKSVV